MNGNRDKQMKSLAIKCKCITNTLFLFRRARKKEQGQVFVMVLIFLLMAGLMIPITLCFVGTGIKTGEVFETKTQTLYAADSGIEDAIWQIKYDRLQVLSDPTDYDEYDFSTSWSYSLPQTINDLTTNVTIQNVWIPKNVTPLSPAEARATIELDDTVEKALPLLEEWNRIGLATTVQHVQTLDNVKEILLHAEKTVIIGDAGRVNYPGQVIGCDYSNAKSIAKDVEAFLFVGGGRFHALGVALSTSKPTIIADPYEKRAYSLDEGARKIFKQRWANIEEAKKAKTFAVLIGLKSGQNRLEEALTIREKLGKSGKSVHLFAVRNIMPEMLMNFPTVDAYVNTACPRISLDNSSKFQKPVLTINETLVVIGELSWEELCGKGLFES